MNDGPKPVLDMHGPGVSPGGNVVEKWAEGLLRTCAKAIADNDSEEVRRHLWILNELSSPYGDVEQKLAHHFLQALFCKARGVSGGHQHRLLYSLPPEKNRSFEAARKVVLRFQELSPWMTFGHVASNGAILEALEGESKLHIVDIGNTYCTQYPTLLESLATRVGDTPHVRLTAVVPVAAMGPTMAEVGRRMERFARLMGVALEFDIVGMGEIGDEESRIVQDEAAVAVNFSGTLHWVEPTKREAFLGIIRELRPKVVTVAEEEADLTSTSNDFLACFEECLRFYSLYFDVIEESFEQACSDERLVLERDCTRGIVGVLANHVDGDGKRRERAAQWCRRLMSAFSPTGFSEDVVGDVNALVRRYKNVGWSTLPAEVGVGLHLAWKNEPVVWASAWKM